MREDNTHRDAPHPKTYRGWVVVEDEEGAEVWRGLDHVELGGVGEVEGGEGAQPASLRRHVRQASATKKEMILFFPYVYYV